MAAADFYQILGVERAASADEIQRAYRVLARTWHPDINKSPEAEARFKEISEAYDVLSDAEMRKRYDAFGSDFRHVPEDVDPAAWAAQQSAQQSARRSGSRTGGRSGDVFVDFGDLGGAGGATFEDLLGGMFGGGGRPRGPSVPQPGPDQEVEVELSVVEAYRGGKHRISLSGGGSPSPGSGGGATGERRFTVTIPAGVTNGQRIRLAGQGAPGRAGGPAGDLYLIIRLRSGGRFRAEGRTISVDLAITPWEATLGANVPVETPGGEAKVRVPPGTSSGTTLRLKGKGMPNPKGAAGDLHAVVKIVVPKQLNDRERELIVELAAASDFNPRSRS